MSACPSLTLTTDHASSSFSRPHWRADRRSLASPHRRRWLASGTAQFLSVRRSSAVASYHQRIASSPESHVILPHPTAHAWSAATSGRSAQWGRIQEVDAGTASCEVDLSQCSWFSCCCVDLRPRSPSQRHRRPSTTVRYQRVPSLKPRHSYQRRDRLWQGHTV